MESNAVVREILKIGTQWERLKKEHPSAKLFCWKGSRLELEFVNAYVQYQLSDQSMGKDTFLIFDHEFEDVFTHGITTLKEFEKGIQAWHDALTDEQKLLKEKWYLKGDPNDSIIATYFVKNLNSLPDYYEFKANETLVIVLSPKSISNIDSYVKWLVDVIDQNIDERIKLMIHDQGEYPFLKDVTKSREVVEVIPSIDAFGAMEAAQKETAGSPDDPQVMFQTHLLNASRYFGKQKNEKALKETQHCINIGKRHELYDLLASVYIFRAGIFTSTKENNKVFKEMDSAIEAAERNPQLLIHAKLIKGSYALRFNDKQLAYECFVDLPEMAEEFGDDHLIIETIRLKGISAEAVGRTQEAWEGYLRAYEVFQEMEEASGNASTFRLVAYQMLSLCGQFGYNQNQFMKDTEDRFGKQWWHQMKKPKKSHLEEVILNTNKVSHGEPATV